MSGPAYRFELAPDLSVVEAEMSLHLGMITLEGLFGASAVRLDVRYHLNEATRSITVDSSAAVGARALVRVFTTLLAREFGEHAFAVHRVANGPLAAEVVTAGGDR